MRPLTWTACALFLSASMGCATLTRSQRFPPVAGVVEEPRAELIRIRTRNGEIRDVQLDAETHYTKWLTHRPFAADTTLDRKSLTVGSCVNVVLRPGQLAFARLVEISQDRPRALLDPCRGMR
jgi:hypothetical protein